MLALAVVSTAFTGQAISTGFDRRYGVLRLLGVTPLGRGGLLLGKAIAVGAVLAVQVLVLGALAAVLGWHPGARGGRFPRSSASSSAPGTFVALALLLAGTLRAEATLALANLIWVVLLGLGLLLPTERLPPSSAPSPGRCPPVRSAMRCGPPWSPGLAVGAVGRAACLGARGRPLTSRLFRWSP